MYILILTLMVGIDGRGHSAKGAGGIATAEFHTLNGCKAAAQKWQQETTIKRRHGSGVVDFVTRSAICVKN